MHTKKQFIFAFTDTFVFIDDHDIKAQNKTFRLNISLLKKKI